MDDRIRKLPNAIPVTNVKQNGIPVTNENGGSIEQEKDPIFNAKLPELALKTELNSFKKDTDVRINNLETTTKGLQSRARAVTKIINSPKLTTNILKFEDASKFYPSNKVFISENEIIKNTDTQDSTNVFFIKGVLNITLAGTNATGNITVFCNQEMNSVNAKGRFNFTAETSLSIPFDFTIPGDEEYANISVMFSSIEGLTTKQIKPCYVDFWKLK